MPTLRIALELNGLRIPLRQALHTAAALEAEAVEIDARGEVTPQLSRTGVRQLRKMLDDLRLRVSAVAFRTWRGYSTAEGLDARIAATKAAMKLAYDLGAPVVLNHIGRLPSESESDSRQLLIGVLQELGEHAHRVGAMLAAETGSEGYDRLARLLADLPEGTVGIDLNPGQLVTGGFSPLEAVAALGPAILSVHLTDALADQDGRHAEPVVIGTGSVDFPALLGALEEHDYRGYFTVGRPNTADPAGQFAREIDYLRKL